MDKNNLTMGCLKETDFKYNDIGTLTQNDGKIYHANINQKKKDWLY